MSERNVSRLFTAEKACRAMALFSVIYRHVRETAEGMGINKPAWQIKMYISVQRRRSLLISERHRHRR